MVERNGGASVNFGILPVQVHFGYGRRNGEMDVPERSMEKLFALAGGSGGSAKMETFDLSSNRGVFFRLPQEHGSQVGRLQAEPQNDGPTEKNL